MLGIGKRFVDILRSDSDPERHYVGVASDVGERLDWHNGGPCGHTIRYRPWRVVVSLEFDRTIAIGHAVNTDHEIEHKAWFDRPFSTPGISCM